MEWIEDSIKGDRAVGKGVDGVGDVDGGVYRVCRWVGRGGYRSGCRVYVRVGVEKGAVRSCVYFVKKCLQPRHFT